MTSSEPDRYDEPPLTPWLTSRDQSMVRALVGDLQFRSRAEERMVVLAVGGDLNALTCETLNREILMAASGRDADDAVIVLDLAELESIDSSGLRALLVSQSRLEMREQTLVLRSPSPAVMRTIEASGLRHVFRIEPAPSG